MSWFKKEEPVDIWADDIDHQENKLTTYAKDEDYNKGLELLIKMKENQESSKKEEPKFTVQDGIQVAGLGVSVFGILSALFLGIGSYRSDENGEMPHSKTWNLGQKLMDKYGRPKN